jgi:peptidoglycan/xylan/chitin deacetylase (PgdA/CDA1 family)
MSDVIVLCYHALSPAWNADLALAPDEFERQIDRLLRQGWHPATFADAVLRPPARRTLAITFDDAFMSVKRYAAPVLSARGATATVFAPTAFMSGGMNLAWAGIDQWLGTPDENELAAMEWSDLRELASLGWEIGSHTRSHPRLTSLDAEQLEAELAGSRADLGSRLDADCLTIAYPYGDVDAHVADAARRAGYVAGAALSSRLTPLGPLRHPRIGIYGNDRAWRFGLKTATPMRSLRASRLWPGDAG